MPTLFVDPTKYGKNIYSQYGEDGIIEQILTQTKIDVQTAMEFGAWNGYHLSNTYALVDKIDKLILIEGDENKYQDLLLTSQKHKSIVPVLTFVEAQGETCVDAICQRLEVKNLDILSVDIDSNDLSIIKNLKIRPKIIIVEFNPTFGALSKYINPIGEAHGNSFIEIYRAMEEKNYSLCSITKTNLFFVTDEVLNQSGYESFRFNNLEILEEIDQHQFKVSCAYDGSKITFGKDKNPWDGSRIAKVRHFPKFMLGWEPTYFQVAARAIMTLRPHEIYRGIKKAKEKGWF